MLQRDGRIANNDLARAIGLSPTPCWRRVRRLEREGVIDRYVALLDPEKVNLGVTVYANVSLENHQRPTVQEFDDHIGRYDEVVECVYLSGTFDYLLKIMVADMAAYERFLSERLMQISGVRTVSSHFCLKRKKATTALPLTEAINAG